MVSAVANATSKIRVGSGGVMLNHYSAYKVAEQVVQTFYLLGLCIMEIVIFMKKKLIT